MKHTEILQADYLDILFDGRNKRYGSYELRKHYDRRVRSALGIMVAIAIGIWCSTLWHKTPPAAISHNTIPITTTIVDIKPPVKMDKGEVLPAAKKIKTQAFTPPVIDRTDKVPEDKVLTKPNDKVVSGPVTSDGDSTDVATTTTTTKTTGTGTIPVLVKPAAPLIYAEVMPQFIGDMNAYINSQLQYPATARETNISGRVLVRFVINEDGAVSNVTIAQGIGGGCDEEAVRMVKSMPKWKPGKQSGMPVKVLFTLPIKFVLN